MPVYEAINTPGSMGPGLPAIPPRGLGPPIIPPYIPPVIVASGTGTINRASQSTLSNVARDAFQTQLNVSAIDEPIRVIFGSPRIGAHIPRALSAFGGQQLVIPILWGRGEIDAINDFTMNGAALPAGATVTHYTGTQTQTVDADLATAFLFMGATWTDALLGFAYSVVTLPVYDSSNTAINLGEFHCKPRGLKCYDPRDGAQSYASPSTWTYTDNPTLCLARILTDDTIGLGMTPNATFWIEVSANATLNDATLSGGEKTRTLNLAIEAQQSAEEWVKALALYAGCFVVPEGSIYRIIPDAAASSVATYTEADMLDGSFSWSRRDILRRPNLVYVRFTEPTTTNNYIPSVAPVGSDVPAIPSGEKRRGQIVEMPGLNKYSLAHRAWIERRNHLYLENLDMSFTLFDQGLLTQLGDVITVSYGTLFTSKLMRIMGIAMTEAGRWRISCSEYDPASYSTVVQTAPTYVDTNLPSPFDPPAAVTSLVLTELPATNDSTSAPMSRIQASCTASASPYVAGYFYEVTDDSSPPVVVYPSTFQYGTDFTSPPLPSPKKYRVNVFPVSTTSVAGTSNSNTIFLAQGTNRMYTLLSQALTSSGWTVGGSVTQTGLSFETVNYVNGSPSVTNRAGVVVPPLTGPDEDIVYSPKYDLGTLCTATVFLDAITAWIADSATIGAWIEANVSLPNMLSIRGRAFAAYIACYDESGALTGSVPFDGTAEITARYFSLTLYGPKLKTDDVLPSLTGVDFADWKVDLTGGTIVAKMHTDYEQVLGITSSAAGSVVATLTNRYLAITGVHENAESTTVVKTSHHTIVKGELQPNKISFDCYDALNMRVAKPLSISVFGVRGSKALTNYALAANGGTMIASSALAGYAASSANDGNRQAVTVGSNEVWSSSTTTFDQWLQCGFGSVKNITEIVFYFFKDDYTVAREPDVFESATLYNPISFEVQEYQSGSFTTISGGTVTGNTKAMRRFACNLNTDYVRILIHSANGGYSRVVEMECIGPA